MTISSVSTSSLATALLQSTSQAKAQLAQASTEISTGQYADLGLQLGARSGYELSLRTETSHLQAMTGSNAVVATALNTTQSALDSIQTDGQNLLKSLATWTSGANSTTAFAQLGSSALQSLTASANTASGGQYLFGGINSGVAPMSDYDSTPTSAAKTAVDQAFQSTFGFAPSDPAAASISASDMQNFLGGPFAALFQGANWTTLWSSASSVNASVETSPGRSTQTSATINTPGFQNLTRAYVMLGEFGDSQLSGAAKQAVVSAGTSLISGGLSSVTSTSATIGAARASVDSANSAISSQLTLLQTQIGNLDAVDPNAAATKIMALQTQLQTAYSLTSRLQNMNLAQYL